VEIMFKNKLNEFFSIEDNNFKKLQKRQLKNNRRIEEYRNELM